MGLKGIIKKISDMMPRETFGNFQTVIIEKKSTAERVKIFEGGPGRYQFDLVCKQENEFAVWIGKSSKLKEDRFEGAPTDKKKVAGKNKVKRITLSGQKYRLSNNDRWLIKVRAESFAERGDNTLEIYCTPLKD